jgi:hypothetical protein
VNGLLVDRCPLLAHGRLATLVGQNVNYKEKAFSRCNHLENIFPFWKNFDYITDRGAKNLLFISTAENCLQPVLNTLNLETPSS